jgi:hypothetical protein
MKNKILAYTVFLTGIAISAVAAYYSIIGLTTIFAGAFWPIVIMGTVLEIGKLAAVSWLYNHWKVVPFLIKAYLTMAIIILMLITSMGIFGLLSKYHIEQQTMMNTGTGEQIQIIDTKLKIHTDAISGIDRQIEQINIAIEKITQSNSGRAGLTAANQQKKTRDDLIKRKQEETKLQSNLKMAKIKLESENKKLEVELGPIKYVAELIYGESSNTVIDKAVRFVILIIIFVFDPLAVLLLIAFNISLNAKETYADMEFLEIKEDKFKRRRKETANAGAKLPLEGGTF